MKIAFLGTGEIGLPTLRYLLTQKEHEIVGVVTQPDKPVGRKMVLTAPMVKMMARDAGIPVLQPEKIRHFTDPLRALKADLFVVVAYGQLLSQEVIDIPKIACLNLHASLLPRHRGASPIQAAILAGDTQTGMTVMHVSLGLDSGDILLKESLEISPQETGGTLHDRLADLGPLALAKALPALETGEAPRTPQQEAAVTHCRKLLREHGVINWSDSSVEIERKVRAYDPWPGTTTLWPMTDGTKKTVKLFPPVQIVSGEGEPGSILEAGASGLVVACGNGALRFQSLQLEGKRRMTISELITGNAFPEKLG